MGRMSNESEQMRRAFLGNAIQKLDDFQVGDRHFPGAIAYAPVDSCFNAFEYRPKVLLFFAADVFAPPLADAFLEFSGNFWVVLTPLSH